MNRASSAVHLAVWSLGPIAAVLLFPHVKSDPEALQWLTIGLTIFVLFFSVVIHELSHGLAALRSGDDTADRAGRLTLNPIRHVSLVGTILVPLLLHLLSVGFVIGWAKPVPASPIKMERIPRDQIFLAVAGPMSNFLLAWLSFTLFLTSGLVFNSLYPGTPVGLHFNILTAMAAPEVPFQGFWFTLFTLLNMGLIINLALGIFNLIPLPPLDGSWLLKAILPGRVVHVIDRLGLLNIAILILALHLGLLDLFFMPIGLLLFLLQALSGSIIGGW